MKTNKLTAEYEGIKFSDEDVINADDYIPAGEYNPHKTCGWLLHDHGFTLAVVFADNESDAIDAAVDADKLDRYLVENEEDYPDGEGLSYLGNASEPFDIESLGIVKLPPVPFSYCALFNAR